MFGEFDEVHALSLDHFRSGILNRRSQRVFFTTDVLHSSITDLLLHVKSPIIFFLDDPSETIAFEVNRNERDLHGSLRFATSCLSQLSEILVSDNALHFYKRDQSDATDIAVRIAKFLDPTINVDMQQAIAATSSFPELKPNESVLDQLVRRGLAADNLPELVLAKQPANLKSVYDVFRKNYMPAYDGQKIENFDVPLIMLYSAESDVSSISLVGPRRLLTWGPYIHLPRGDWEAVLSIEIKGNFSGNEITVDAFSVDVGLLAEASAVLPKFGIYSCSLSFSVFDVEQAIEIRCSLRTGAIEGTLRICALTFRRNFDAHRGTAVLIVEDAKALR